MSDLETSAEVLVFTVPPDRAGARLDRVLAGACPALSRRRIQSLIRDGHVTAGGATLADPAHKVKPGTRLALAIPESPAEAEAGAQDLPLTVVHEDAHVIVVDKPAGLVVHPAAGTPDGTLVNALIAHCGGGFIGTGPEHRRGIVHRLDKDTSGLLVAAKTETAEQHLIAQFQAHSVSRRYVGLVRGRPSPPRGTLTGPIGRSPANRKKMAVLAEGGRSATTHYAVREVLAGGAASVVDFRLETGRTHQIRVHMAEVGHPVLGDTLYGRGAARVRRGLPPDGRAAVDALARQALHATELGFAHPADVTPEGFASPIPADMARTIAALGGRLANPDEYGHI